MMNSKEEIEELIRTERIQMSQRMKMKEENIKKANDILRKLFAEASKNEVTFITRTVRVNSYE